MGDIQKEFEKLLGKEKPGKGKGTPPGADQDVEKRKATLRAKLDALKDKLKPAADKGTSGTKRKSKFEDVLEERARKRREAPKGDKEVATMTRTTTRPAGPW